MALYTAIMTPKNQEVRAVLAFCHGYSDHISFVKRAEYQRFVHQGIAVVGIDYEGHGRSDGPAGLIYDFQLVVDDVLSYFHHVSHAIFPGKKVFLMGEVSSTIQMPQRSTRGYRISLTHPLDSDFFFVTVHGRCSGILCVSEIAFTLSGCCLLRSNV